MLEIRSRKTHRSLVKGTNLKPDTARNRHPEESHGPNDGVLSETGCVIYVVDQDYERRTEIVFRVASHGLQVIGIDPTKTKRPPKSRRSLYVYHDDPACSIDCVLQNIPDRAPFYLYSKDVSPLRITEYIQRGAMSYFRWRSDLNSMTAMLVQSASSSRVVQNNIGFADEIARRSNAKARLQCLTRREVEVLKLIADGLLTQQIAEVLEISTRTAELHRSNMLRKSGCNTMPQLVRSAIDAQLV